MRTYILFLLLTFSSCQIYAQQEMLASNIVPQPVSVEAKSGSFTITNNTGLYFSSSLEPSSIKVFASLLQAKGFQFQKSTAANATDAIAFVINTTAQSQLGDEGYDINVSPKNITVAANTAGGLFHGLQSLLQLIPLQENSAREKNGKIVECVHISDYPRFKWRGMMLDVARHFFPKDAIKSLIDEMVKYKYNVFHWHLTDDQGWRIEIKGLPRLTEVGAWRVHREGEGFMHYEKPKPEEKATDGGFYTQADIREIVDYANKRFVTILPEIDMPAHSLALVASYPDISCRQQPMFVSPGSPLTEEEDNVLCVANDSTYLIIDKILTQVAELFPGPYLHIGGDEAYKGFWDKCPKCRKLEKDNNLKNGEELQSFFIKKVAAIVASKNKKVIGWEEIMQGGLAPNAAIMSWTSTKAGIEASKAGHNVVLTPWDHGFYMDNSRLEKTYLFDMTPGDADGSYILGGEACLWSENVPTVRQMQYMFWPRSMVLANVFWSRDETKDWSRFTHALESKLTDLDRNHIKYSTAIYEPVIVPVRDTVNKTLKIRIDSEIKQMDIYYSFDGSDPDNYYPKYSGQILAVPQGAQTIRAVAYRDGKQMGRLIVRRLDSLGKRRHDD